MTAIRGYFRLSLLIAAALMLAVACDSEVSEIADGVRGRVEQATSTGPQWSEYIPARNGRVCTYSSSYADEAMDFAVDSTQTSEYTDVHEESDGTHFTVESTTETTTDMEVGDGETNRVSPPPTTANLKYVLADDGTLRSEPELFGGGDTGTGLEVSVDEFIVYPTVDVLRRGESRSASIAATVRSTDPEAQAELEEDLEPGESAMEMRLDYTVEGVPPKEISTPAGTFTDVVGVSLKFDGVEVTNANAEARRDMDGVSELFTGMLGTTTVWYARDVGGVQTEIEGGLAEAMMEDATSGVPAVKLEGCSNDPSSEPDTDEPTSPEPADEPGGDDEMGGPSENQYDSDQYNSDGSGDGSLEASISEYYEAAGAEDWDATYSMLDGASQGVYTESEWSALQDERQAASPLPPVSSVEISETTENGDGTIAVGVVLNPGEDSEMTSTVTVSYNGGQYYRHLTPDEVAYLNGLGSGGSEIGSNDADLGQVVEDFYLAGGANEWGETYQYLDSRTQDEITEEQWTERNRFLFERNPVIYYIDSIESEGGSADVTLRISGEDGTFIMNEVVRFVSEDGGWRYSPSASELESLMPDATFEEFLEAQGGAPSDGDDTGVCAGVSDCEIVDTADVDGDGSLDEVALVGEPDEYPAGRTRITVRVLLADGTTLTREAELEYWHSEAWLGATDFGQVPGEELVIGAMSGAHTLYYRVLTYRDGELVDLPYPRSEPYSGDTFSATLWPIDAAASVSMGVVCDTTDSTVVLRSVSSVGPPSEDTAFEGEETSWVLDGDQWRMTGSQKLEYPDADSAFEIAGWQCGDLPRVYD